MTSPGGLLLQSVRLLSAKLWEDKKVIDEFILHGENGQFHGNEKEVFPDTVWGIR